MCGDRKTPEYGCQTHFCDNLHQSARTSRGRTVTSWLLPWRNMRHLRVDRMVWMKRTIDRAPSTDMMVNYQSYYPLSNIRGLALINTMNPDQGPENSHDSPNQPRPSHPNEAAQQEQAEPEVSNQAEGAEEEAQVEGEGEADEGEEYLPEEDEEEEDQGQNEDGAKGQVEENAENQGGMASEQVEQEGNAQEENEMEQQANNQEEGEGEQQNEEGEQQNEEMQAEAPQAEEHQEQPEAQEERVDEQNAQEYDKMDEEPQKDEQPQPQQNPPAQKVPETPKNVTPAETTPKPIEQSIKKPNPSQNPETKPSPKNIGTDKYISKLQILNSKNQQRVKQLEAELAGVMKLKNDLKKKNKDHVQIEVSLQMQVTDLTQKVAQTQKEVTQKSKKIEDLEGQLAAYREIGDIRSLLARVGELEGLLQDQKKQFALLQNAGNQMVDEGQQAELKLSHLKKLQSLQEQQQTMSDKILLLESKLSEKEQICTQNAEDMSSMDNQIKEQIEKINSLTEELNNERIQASNRKAAYEERINKLEMQQASGRQHETIEDMIRDKEILLREYSRLELEYSTLSDRYTQTKTQLQETQLEHKLTDREKVTRKEWNDMVNKFKKCKACLEKAIRENKILRELGNGGLEVFQNKSQELKLNQQGSEQSDQLNRYVKVFSEHVQSSAEYLKNINEISQDSTIARLNNQLYEIKGQLTLSVKKSERYEQLSTMLESELAYKNSLLTSLMEKHKNLRKEYDRLKEENLTIQEELSENIFAKGSLSRLQSSSKALIVKNRKLLKDTEHWRELYYSMKGKYERMLQKRNIQPQLVDESLVNAPVQKQAGQDRMQAEPIAKESASQETQTEGMNQFYYKQLKEMLSLLKKFPKKTEAFWKQMESQESEVMTLHKKLQQVQEQYNLKFRKLKQEKSENETWRSEERVKIAKQFHDIRELVDSDRLVTVLRKAKYLIDELEAGNEGEEEGEIQQEGEANKADEN